MSLSELSSQVVTVECAVNTCSCVVSLISGVLFINEYHVLKIFILRNALAKLFVSS